MKSFLAESSSFRSEWSGYSNGTICTSGRESSYQVRFDYITITDYRMNTLFLTYCIAEYARDWEGRWGHASLWMHLMHWGERRGGGLWGNIGQLMKYQHVQIGAVSISSDLFFPSHSFLSQSTCWSNETTETCDTHTGNEIRKKCIIISSLVSLFLVFTK